ncbi:MAG: hypothetical protein PHS14_17405, partial [Elusimicrobia bacterium]|nr:hypothetical protein [Elusimicrobiota bacterium]
LKAAGPEAVGKYVQSYQKAVKDAYGKAVFDLAAGSPEDLQKDVETFFKQILPKLSLQAAFGQMGYGMPLGDRDWAGGAAGTDWNTNSAAMDAAGNFINKQLFDPNAPIPLLLTGIGFTQGRIGEIAQKLADTADLDAFKKWLDDLVGLVAGAQDLGKLMAQSYGETVSVADADAARSPSGKLAEQEANVRALLETVSLYAGDEQVTKGKEALAAAQQFYDAAKTAMLQLSAMTKQINQEYLDSVKKVQDALKTPAELAAQSVEDLTHDYERMRFAANPEDLAKAWAKARSDFEAVAGELVNRIRAIRSILDDIHTLQAAMLTGPGANAQTDPKAWLAENLTAMEKYRTAMTLATPGSPEQIAAATSFAGLIRDRYQMELDLLARVRSTIESINQSIDEQLFGISLGEAGSANAKSTLIYGQIEKLYEQLQGAKTPEEVQRLTSQIQGLAGQLLQLSPAGTAGHDAMVKYVRELLEKVRSAALGNLGVQGQGAELDLASLGTYLADAEKVMKGALESATGDLDKLVKDFGLAADYATGKLHDWGVEIEGQLNALAPVLAEMVTNFTDVNTALSGGTGTGGGGGGNPKLPENLDALGTGVSDARGALVDFTDAVRAGTAALAG